MLRRVVLLAAALALSVAPAAQADGDPASDVLATQDVYYPYSPRPTQQLVDALDRLLADVREAGYPMKVAIIATAADLGAYPTMFNDPQRYTDLLATGLPTNPHGNLEEALHVLVVMPGGFGGKNLGERVDEALAPIDIEPEEGSSDPLVRAALKAVARIASVNGHETRVPAAATAPLGEGEEASEGIPRTAALIVVAIVALLLGAGMLVVRRRTATSDGRPPLPQEAQAEGQKNRST